MIDLIEKFNKIVQLGRIISVNQFNDNKFSDIYSEECPLVYRKYNSLNCFGICIDLGSLQHIRNYKNLIAIEESKYVAKFYEHNNLCYSHVALLHDSTGIVSMINNSEFNLNCNETELECKLFQLSTTNISDEVIIGLRFMWNIKSTWNYDYTLYVRNINIFIKNIDMIINFLENLRDNT